MLRCDTVEDYELGRWQGVYRLCQPRFVPARGVFLDHALLHGLIDQAEGAGKYRFRICRFPGFNCSSEFLYLRFELMTIGLIESFKFQALTVSL